MVRPAGLAVGSADSPKNPKKMGTDHSPARRVGTVIEIAGQPFFPRIIQHNGEPFELLRDLGFNTVQLSSAPTDQQLISANDAGVWLVCPPPASLGIVPLGDAHDRIIAWSLGNRRRGPDFALGQQLRDQILQHDIRNGRPVVAEVQDGYQAWGGMLDAAIVGTSPQVVGFDVQGYGRWVDQARLALGDRIPVWADVPGEYPVELVRQIMAMAGRVPPLPMDPQTLELLAFQAIANGARGIRVTSRSRLDANDPQTRLRALTLRWLNHRLAATESWVASGVIIGHDDEMDGGTRVSALKNSRGQLLIAQRHSNQPFPVPGDSPVQTIRLPDRWSSVSDQAWHVTDEGLVPLAGRYHIGETEIQLDQAPWSSLVVVTQDPALVARINEQLNRLALRGMIDLRRELTSQWLAILQLVTEQMETEGRNTSEIHGAVTDAVNLLRQAEANAQSSAPALATFPLDQADQRLAMARQRLFRIARQPFSAHTSSPLLQHAATLPEHWVLATGLASQNRTWDPNGLAGGDFENLQHMLNAGWENARPADTSLVTEVALTASDRFDGEFALRLAARHAAAHPGLAEAPPLQITSAPVFVRANKLVRIHGWVRIPQPITSTVHGLTIYDSLGGRDLAVCCQQSAEWQEVTLYRAAGEDSEVRVRIVLEGYGEAFVDEMTVQTIDLPAGPVASATAPSTRLKK